MKTRGSLVRHAVAVTVAVAVGIVAAGSPAQAAPVPTGGDVATTCVTVIGKADHGRGSPILAHSCWQEAAQRRSAPPRLNGSTLLVVFFEDVGYSGDTSYVYGDDGTCDIEGYGIDDMDGVQDDTDGVSSYQLVGNCNVSEKFAGYDFAGTWSGLIFGQNQSWVGQAWNDGGIRSFSMHQNPT